MGATLNLSLRAVEGSASIAQNTSQVHIVLKITTDSGTYNLTGSTRGSITLDGSTVVSLDGKMVQYNTTTTLYDGIHTVSHGPDGTKTVTVKAQFDVDTPMTGVRTAQTTLTLAAIARRATMTVPVFTLGQGGAMRVDCQEGFTYTVTYALGAQRGTAVEKSVDTAPVWTPPMELARAFPDAPSAQGTLTLTTYDGEAAIGENTYPFTVLAPDALAPGITQLQLSFNGGETVDSWGVAVKGRTKLRYEVTAQGQLGAQIRSCVFSCGGVSAAGLSGLTAALMQPGTFVPQVSVTDSRGKTAVLQGEAVTVLDYEPPAFTASAAYRCGADGSASAGGTYAAVSASATFAPVGGHNSLTLRARCRAVGGAWGGYTQLQAGEVTVLSGFDAAVSYEVEVEAVDAVGESRTVVYTLSTESVAFHLRQGGLGAAFGKYAEKDGWLESGWPMDLRGNRLCGLGVPVADDEAVPLGLLEERLVALSAALYPPMVPGVEYATAQQWNGQQVYVTAVEFAALPQGGLAEGGALAAGLTVVELRGVVRRGANTMPLPGCPGVEELGYDAGTGRLWIRTGEDLSDGSALVVVKYTK